MKQYIAMPPTSWRVPSSIASIFDPITIITKFTASYVCEDRPSDLMSYLNVFQIRLRHWWY